MSVETSVQSADTLDRMIRQELPLQPEDKQKLLDALEAAATALAPHGERS